MKKNLALIFFLLSASLYSAPIIHGNLVKYGVVMVDMAGPTLSETGTPNPFKDCAYQVTFSRPGTQISVTGYFAADGNAGESSATSGSIWRALFVPTESGVWNYQISFLEGVGVALGGTGTGSYDNGYTGSFSVAATPASATGFMQSGPLQYTGDRYLHTHNGALFLKAGTDSPENLLGYYEFDNTSDNGGSSNSLNGTTSFTTTNGTFAYHGDGLHHFDDHLSDWNTGDPAWQGTKGKRIIGAIRYLAENGLNGLDILSMNINGDGREVYPYVTYNGSASPQVARTRFDCSKLDQWYKVIKFANEMGILVQFKTQELENDDLLDAGQLGTERKLYYRELIARFGSLPGIEWNLGEEYDAYLTIGDPNLNVLKACASYIQDTDAYSHNIVAHTWPNQISYIYSRMQNTSLSGASMQTDLYNVHKYTYDWSTASISAGKKWVVCSDEQGPANDGLISDGASSNWEDIRRYVLWGNLMSGGGGVNYYFGYSYPHSDLNCETFRSRSSVWPGSSVAISVLSAYNLSAMSNRDDLVGNSTRTNSRYCLAEVGARYFVYLPSGGSHNLNLAAYPGILFSVKWVNPSTGAVTIGSSILGGSNVSVGSPPAPGPGDWLAIIENPGVLAIEFTLAYTTVVRDSVQVSWEVYADEPIAYFSVRRSNDGLTWEEVGRKPYIGPGEYDLWDRPGVGRYFYKIVSMASSGDQFHSRIVEASVTFERVCDAYISTSKEGISLIADRGVATARIISASDGRLVGHLSPERTKLAPGIYCIAPDNGCIQKILIRE